MLNEQSKNNEEWGTYLIDYRYEGSRWTADLLAENIEDAKYRLRAIKGNAWIEGGPVVERIYIPLPESTPKPVLVTIGNFLASVMRFLRNWRDKSPN